MIGHKLLMLLEQVLSLIAFTHRRVEFLTYLGPDVLSIVHHFGSCFIWKQHLPDLLMGSSQLNLLYISSFAAVEPSGFLFYFIWHFINILWKTNGKTEPFLITVTESNVFPPTQLSWTQKDTLSTCPHTLPFGRDSRNNNNLAVRQSADHPSVRPSLSSKHKDFYARKLWRAHSLIQGLDYQH